MALRVETVKNMPTPNGLIAFAPESPFLITGSKPGSGCIKLRVLRTCLGLDRRQLIDPPVAELAVPSAAFCRLCWSKPLGSSSPAGLVAGGLESGEVVVWNPAKALSNIECLHPEEKRFVHSLQESLECEYDFCHLEKSRKSPASAPVLQDMTGNLVAADSLSLHPQDPVARFAKHVGEVRGLEFGSHWSNLIASGAQNGRIMVWDLSNPSSETVPTWQTESTEGDAISCISWSPLLPRVLGSSSLQGVFIWDTRSSKSPVKSVGLFPRKLSGIAFSPVEQFSVVVSCEDYLDKPSLAVWDLRQMTEPVSELCDNSKGVIAMAWSPHHDDTLLVSTKNDKIMLWSLAKQEAIWSGDSDSGRYYDLNWSPSSRGVFAAASHNNLDLFKLNDRASMLA